MWLRRSTNCDGYLQSCVVILAGMTTWLSSGMLTFTFSTQIIYLRNVLIMLPAVICFLRKDNGAFWFQHIFQHFAKKGRFVTILKC